MNTKMESQEDIIQEFEWKDGETEEYLRKMISEHIKTTLMNFLHYFF